MPSLVMLARSHPSPTLAIELYNFLVLYFIIKLGLLIMHLRHCARVACALAVHLRGALGCWPLGATPMLAALEWPLQAGCARADRLASVLLVAACCVWLPTWPPRGRLGPPTPWLPRPAHTCRAVAWAH